MYYTIIILSANFVIAFVNAIVEGGFLKFLTLSLAATAKIIAVDGITAFLIRRLPERFFDASSTPPCPRWERSLYRSLKVKKWSAFVPELGVFTGFTKRELKSRDDKEYLARFILESNYGVCIHIVNALFGAVIWLLPAGNIASVGIPVFSVNFVLSLLPAAILRNNLPVLQKLYGKRIAQ